MLCELCNKNHATIHLTEITNNTKKELHICEECAKKKGTIHKVSFSIADILGKLADPIIGKALKEMTSLKCPQCGMTYAEFRAKARFGCANDFEVFKAGLVPLLEKVHGSAQHCGKVPATADTTIKKESEIIKLKKELDQLVKMENFEKAAEIRDRIQLLEAELGNKNPTS